MVPLTLVLGLAPACGGGGGGGADVLENKLQDCGLLSDGTFIAGDLTGDERCLPGCLADKSCDVLEATYCEQDTTAFSDCVMQCGSYQCDDGTTILDTWECDGFEDCAGAEDEANCPTFTCDDGLEVPASYECDGFPDCEDSSDEADCPAPDTFNCGDGSMVPATWQCDGEADCENGRDEEDCATFTCPA